MKQLRLRLPVPFSQRLRIIVSNVTLPLVFSALALSVSLYSSYRTYFYEIHSLQARIIKSGRMVENGRTIELYKLAVSNLGNRDAAILLVNCLTLDSIPDRLMIAIDYVPRWQESAGCQVQNIRGVITPQAIAIYDLSIEPLVSLKNTPIDKTHVMIGLEVKAFSTNGSLFTRRFVITGYDSLSHHFPSTAEDLLGGEATDSVIELLIPRINWE